MFRFTLVFHAAICAETNNYKILLSRVSMGQGKSAVFLIGEKNAKLERLISRVEEGGRVCTSLSDLNDSVCGL